MRCLAAAVALLATLLFVPPASAEFGFQAINEPGAVSVPAIPGDSSAWFGACDLSSASTENGGFGAASGPRPHCMHLGAFGSLHWSAQNSPQWRLDPSTQAGAHPDATALFSFETLPELQKEHPDEETGFIDVDENVKDIIVRLPPGVVGSPATVPQCSAVQVQFVPTMCPAESQVGIATVTLTQNSLMHPVYNVEARDTVTAELVVANVASLFNVPVTARGRTNGDYGVDTLALLIPSYLSLLGQAFTVWGVPWAEVHDPYRLDRDLLVKYGSGIPPGGVTEADRIGYDPSWGPIKPFFTNATRCSGSPLSTGIDVASWQDQSDFVSYELGVDVLDGCDKLSFDPGISLRPTVDVADSPAGIDVRLEVPQNNDPPQEALGNPNLSSDPDDDTGAPAYWKTDAGLATAHLKDTTVRLPTGTSFNPAAANGLHGCTSEQVGLTSTVPSVTFDNEKVTCPDTSKLGTLEIVTPLLPNPLHGEVFAAPQHDNPFPGSLTAIYMVAQDEERGLSVKLPGKVDLDPRTGQISTTFLDNPQLPFESFDLHFKTGPRAPLNTPPVCGQFRNRVDLTPWSFPHSGPISSIQDPFDVKATPNGQPCVTEPEDRLFAPAFEAGSTSIQAGAHTLFNLNVTRRDGDQELSGLSLQMPDGLTAKLAGTPACPDATLAAIEQRTGLGESLSPACPAAAQLGTVDTLAGAGSLPLPTSGRLYLAGPFDPDGAGSKPMAPLSVAAVVPAIAGGDPARPTFDLGNVVVRNAVYLDPRTAQVQIASTPLPYIVGGVPLRVRRISVRISKPGFMLNPTDCSEMSIGATLSGAADPLDLGDDTMASKSSRFQVGGCDALGFKPRLRLALKGGTRRGQNPALTAVLRARPGDANIARAAVTLPRSAFLDQEHLDTICTRVQFAADACPKGSVVGRATAHTPLLDGPLIGPVYLRSSDNKLPDMVAALVGPDPVPIEVELVGRIDSHRRSIRSTFDLVPDAPVSEFILRMRGGKRGLIENSKNICASPSRAMGRFTAQNGRTLSIRPIVRALSCKARGRKGSKDKG